METECEISKKIVNVLVTSVPNGVVVTHGVEYTSCEFFMQHGIGIKVIIVYRNIDNSIVSIQLTTDDGHALEPTFGIKEIILSYLIDQKLHQK